MTSNSSTCNPSAYVDAETGGSPVQKISADAAHGLSVLHDLAAHTAVVFYRMSLPEGHYTYVSAGVAMLTGYSAEEFYAKPVLIRELMHPEWRRYFEEKWRELLAGVAPSFYEYAIRDRRGETRWLRQQNVLLRDEQGRPQAVEGVVYEVTSYKRAESALEHLVRQRAGDIEALRRQLSVEAAAHEDILMSLRGRDRQLRLLTDHLPAAISYVDNAERYRFTNRIYEDWFGHAHDELYGKTIREVLGDAAYAVVKEKVRAALSGQPVTFEATVPYARGGTRHVRASYIPHRGERGDVRGFYVLVSDISDSKRAETAEKRHMQELAHAARLASLGEMAAQLGHELAQPLSAIANYSHNCSMLLEKGDVDRAKEVAARLRAQSGLATEIIGSLRRFMQKGVPEKQRVDMLEIVQDALKMAQWDAQARHVPLRMEAPASVPTVHADRTLIEQVALNLLRNALDAVDGQAGRDKGVTVSIDAFGDAVQVSVRDHGPGVVPEVKARLFEPFFTTKPNGVGIGLVICRRIIESHGGRLWADDGPDGQGAVFRFTLPHAAAP